MSRCFSIRRDHLIGHCRDNCSTFNLITSRSSPLFQHQTLHQSPAIKTLPRLYHTPSSSRYNHSSQRQKPSPATTNRIMSAAATHAIFDMDGLLLDTETLYTVVQQDICKRYNKTFTWELKSKMMGLKAIEAARVFITDLDLSNDLTPEDFIAEREEALDRLFPSSQLLPGVERLLRHLHSHQIPMCLATSSHRRHYTLKTTQHTELFSLFDHVITGDQVSKGKPAPDIFLKAIESYNNNTSSINVGQCLVFEDAPSGVQAAKSAGMMCCMVPDGQLDASHHQGADLVIPSLLDFDPAVFGLPAFAASSS